MTAAERHARASALFLEALDRPPATRAAWLAAACDDAEVCRRVGALLEGHDAPDGLLDRPALVRPAPEADPLVGRRVGPWRVTARLGRGGMGAVYRAARADATFEQEVALKVVRPGLEADFRARFVRERAVLAGLDHAGIARLIDGGVAADGTPYLTTELVAGEPITAWADRRGLGVEARLRLFLQACDAVAYAHRSLVVHRDLKPAHVLVADEPGGGRVKLLDFGVAKLLEADAVDLTRTGPGPMTPAYAAPEQLLGRPVTTATDVYALGVVLYELLSGRRPYDLGGLTAAQVERAVCETVPPRPSEAARDGRATARLRGDLDAVVRKALAKEPERRYPSAEALADDLRRHLDGLPVRARPAMAGYRVGRFVRRHRAAVAAATALVVLVTALTGLHTLRLGAERDRARAAAAEAAAQAERAEAVAGFLEQILRAPNSRWYNDAEATGPGTPIRAVLDEAARRVGADFATRPGLRADLHHVLGDTYLALGLYPEARAHHRATLALRESLYAAPDPRLAEALYYASVVDETAAGRVGLLRRAVAMQRALPEGNNFPFMAQELARLYRLGGRPADAVPLLRDGLAFVRAEFTPGRDAHRYRAPLEAALADALAQAHLDLGAPEAAGRWLAGADSALAVAPDDGAGALTVRTHQCVRGRWQLAAGRADEAERTLEACLAPAPALPYAPVEAAFGTEAGAVLAAHLESTGRPVAPPYRRAAARHRALRDSVRRALREADRASAGPRRAVAAGPGPDGRPRGR